METQESHRSHRSNHRNLDYIRGPPSKYEKLIQKLESDVRGHIRVSYKLKLRFKVRISDFWILVT